MTAAPINPIRERRRLRLACGPWRRRHRPAALASRSNRSRLTRAGGLVAKGSAEPNSTLRLYLNQADLAEAKTQSDGRWSLTIQRGMTPGGYVMRADKIGPTDTNVVASADTPFDYPDAPDPRRRRQRWPP